VRNPTGDGIEFTKRVAVALPGEEAGPVSRGFDAGLGPGEAVEIDRDDIFEHAGTGESFLEGFVGSEVRRAHKPSVETWMGGQAAILQTTTVVSSASGCLFVNSCSS
jgi:hypothetical protein